MRILCTLLFWSLITVSTIVFTILGCLAVLIPVFGCRYWVITRWSWVFVTLAKHLRGVTYQVDFDQPLPSTPCIIVANHQSAWETFLMQCVFPPQSWVLKRSLLWIPIFGWGLALLRPIAINRGSPKQAAREVQEKGLKRLKEGLWVVIFPEGTRVPPGEEKTFSKSAARLAEASGVPIIPVAHNAGTVWPTKGPAKSGHIMVRVGRSFSSNGRSVENLHKDVSTWIQTHRRALEAKRPDSPHLEHTSQ